MPPKKRKASASAAAAPISKKARASSAQPSPQSSTDASTTPLVQDTPSDGSSLSDLPEFVVDPAQVEKRQATMAGSPQKEDILATLNKNFGEVMSQVDIEANPTLRNTRYMKRFLDNAQLLRFVAPYAQPENERLMNDVLELDPIPNKIVRVAGVEKSTGRWMCRITDNEGRPGKVGLAKPKEYYVIIHGFPLDEANLEKGRASGRDIGNLFCDMLSRFDIGTPDATTRQLLMRVACQLTVGAPRTVIMPTFEMERGIPAAITHIRHIDPKEGTTVSSKFSLTSAFLEHLELDDVPEIPDYDESQQHFDVNNRAIEMETTADGSTEWPSRIPASVVKKGGSPLKNCRVVEKFFRYVGYRLSNLVATKDRMKEMFADLQEDFGIDPGMHRPRSYGGSHLLIVKTWPKRVTTTLGLSEVPQKDLKKSTGVPLICIRSLNHARTVQPMDTALQHYLCGKDIRVALLYCAQAADIVNHEILEAVPVSHGCECSEAMSKCTRHHCFGCHNETLCARLDSQVLPGSRLCPACKFRNDAGLEQKAFDVAKAKIEHSTKENHVAECQTLGKNVKSANEQKRLADMKDVLKEFHLDEEHINEWTDAYTQLQRTVELEAPQIALYGRTMLADLPSVDAVEPYSLSHDGQIRSHTADNVVVTTIALNYIKHIQVVGFLEELSRYHKRGDYSAIAQLDFLTVCDTLHAIRSKVPYFKKARSKLGPSGLETDRAEWRSGKLLDEEGPWDPTLWRFISGTVPQGGFDEETIGRLTKISRQIQRSFDKDLQEADDGAPWIADKEGEAMPEGWGWDSWFNILSVRCLRMEYFCNKWWQQVDTTQSLFCEWIWQLCADYPEYEEFLNLPRTIWIRHPLRTSIAHRHHGQQMRTGWPPRPQDISDRVDSQNNLLFETWTSNVAKMDIPESLYDSILTMVDAIAIPRKFYNPDLKITTSREATTVELTEDDMYREGNNGAGGGGLFDEQEETEEYDEDQGDVDEVGEAGEGQDQQYEDDE